MIFQIDFSLSMKYLTTKRRQGEEGVLLCFNSSSDLASLSTGGGSLDIYAWQDSRDPSPLSLVQGPPTLVTTKIPSPEERSASPPAPEQVFSPCQKLDFENSKSFELELEVKVSNGDIILWSVGIIVRRNSSILEFN